MKKLFNNIIFSLLLAMAGHFMASAQDIHFSEFYETSIINNPGLTGIFSEDYKVTFLYRSQWATVAEPYKTTLISAEGKIKLNIVNDYLSFGLLGYSDNAGTINFKTVAFYPAVNYNKSLEDKFGSYLNVGFTGGYVQRSIDVSKMTFDNQYQNGVFVPNSGSGETQSFKPSLSNWDLGTGVSFNSSFDEANKINYFLGVSAYHLTGMKTSMLNDNSVQNLSTRWNGNLGLNYVFDETYSARFYLNYMTQNPYREIISGIMLRWSAVNQLNKQPFALCVGGFYRVNDAIIPTVKLDYKGNAFAVAYDVNTSSLKSVSNMRGAFEISISRIGLFHNGFDDKHACPRF